MTTQSSFYELLLCTLAVWRLTHLLQAEDGPWDVVVRLRRLVGEGFWGSLLDCFYCLSVWISAPFAWWLGSEMSEKLLLWPALSGAASLLQLATVRRAEPGPVLYSEAPLDFEEQKGD